MKRLFFLILTINLLWGCAASKEAACASGAETASVAPEAAVTNRQPAAVADQGQPAQADSDGNPVIVPAGEHYKEMRKDELDKWINLSLSVMIMAESAYVDPVERETLRKNAMNGMLSALDPFSEFFSPEDFAILQSGTSGSFGGIGVESVGNPEGGVSIMAPLEGTPAYEAGLMPFDVLREVNGQDVRKATMNTVTKLLRGDPGTFVTVSVSRTVGGRRETPEFVLKRAVINVNSVPEASMLGDSKIGYIRLATFDKNMVEGLAGGLQKLGSMGMKALIIDLRNNGGGLLEAAAKAAELFVPNGALIVSTKGRTIPEKEIRSTCEPIFDGPIAVLVNGATASASEILSGALRCQCGAVLVGDKTFGKGSVQNVINVGSNGYGMKMTVAHYYTPDGVCIHKKGLMPDIPVKVAPDEEKTLRDERMQERAKEFEHLASPDRREPSENDRALLSAMALLKREINQDEEQK